MRKWSVVIEKRLNKAKNNLCTLQTVPIKNNSLGNILYHRIVAGFWQISLVLQRRIQAIHT